VAIRSQQKRAARTVSATPVRDYWPRFEERFTYVTILMQIITTIAVGVALIGAGVLSVSSLSFWIVLFAVCIASICVNLAIFQIVTEPLKNILFALTHAADEPTTTAPPNPNARGFARNGLKEVLQVIYSLSANRSKTQPSVASQSLNSLSNAIGRSSTGLVVLDGNNEIIYANQSAPIKTNVDGRKELELIFNNEQSIEHWIKSCDNKVSANKIWSHVANKLPGEDGREFYDISADFQKDSLEQTVLTFFPRTDLYLPEEEDVDFIAFAAHELRGPITVIRGYLDVLRDEMGGDLDEEKAVLMQRLVVSANRLSSYVNNILNASRYDRRHLKIHLYEDTVHSIYDIIADDMNMRAVAQNRLLSANIPKNLPSVAADRSSISEVMGNLIDNGIKYSNEGGLVEISAKVSGDFVEVSVTDQGIGMPGSVVKNLFHKFYRSHRSRETVAGTGIGLYICKAMVESHGGTISVRSQEGVGSVFSFTIPIYATVVDKLSASGQLNESLISEGSGWIKNHSMYRG
jgi:two-component system phosphate regulon sensor histidine kinase PhoR/two-component system sensor histidine kinase VicK